MSEMTATSPVVLVHGLIGSLRDLLPVFAAHGVEAYAPDLLGYGELKDTPPGEIGLHQQVAHLAAWMDRRGLARVRLVGHSVGGAVAMLFAHAHPERVSELTTIEGNFSLADAFWSAAIARMSREEAEAVIEGFRADPAGWLARSGVAPEPRYIAAAERLLADQPASTIQATARSVVDVTGAASYEHAVRAIFESSTPVRLVAGERSRAGWQVPEWALASAASETLLPGGHLMMVEAPERFVRAVAGLA